MAHRDLEPTPADSDNPAQVPMKFPQQPWLSLSALYVTVPVPIPRHCLQLSPHLRSFLTSPIHKAQLQGHFVQKCPLLLPP